MIKYKIFCIPYVYNYHRMNDVEFVIFSFHRIVRTGVFMVFKVADKLSHEHILIIYFGPQTAENKKISHYYPNFYYFEQKS